MSSTSSPMTFVELLGLSFRAPADAMRALQALKPGPQAVWLGFAIATLLSTIVDSLLLGPLADMAEAVGMLLVAPAPVPMALSKACLMVLAAAFLTRLATVTEGREQRFTDILLALVWFRTVAALAAGLVLAVFLLAPGLGLFFLMAVNLYSGWLALNFVSVALSDAPLGRTLVILLIAVILSLLAMALLMMMLGVLLGRGGGVT